MDFVDGYTNLFGLPKKIKSNRGGAFISREFQEYCTKRNIELQFGTANLHTGTGLVERTIQSLKNLIKANMKDKLDLKSSLDRALKVLRFTKKNGSDKSPFELHFGRKPNTELNLLASKMFNGRKDVSVEGKLPVYITRNSDGQITDHIVMAKRRMQPAGE